MWVRLLPPAARKKITYDDLNPPCGTPSHSIKIGTVDYQQDYGLKHARSTNPGSATPEKGGCFPKKLKVIERGDKRPRHAPLGVSAIIIIIMEINNGSLKTVTQNKSGVAQTLRACAHSDSCSTGVTLVHSCVNKRTWWQYEAHRLLCRSAQRCTSFYC